MSPSFERQHVAMPREARSSSSLPMRMRDDLKSVESVWSPGPMARTCTSAHKRVDLAEPLLWKPFEGARQEGLAAIDEDGPGVREDSWH